MVIIVSRLAGQYPPGLGLSAGAPRTSLSSFLTGFLVRGGKLSETTLSDRNVGGLQAALRPWLDSTPIQPAQIYFQGEVGFGMLFRMSVGEICWIVPSSKLVFHVYFVRLFF